jgi:hypothetical protein
MPWPEPITLRGSHAILEPLSHAYHDDLVEAVQDGELWKLWYTVIAPPEKMREEIDRRLDLQSKGTMLPFAVIDTRTAKAVGMTTYMNIDAPNRRVEIGSTWYRKSVQRTPLIASAWSCAHTSSTMRAGGPLSGWAPSWTEYCATIRSCRTGQSATHARTASLPLSGPR